MTDMEGFLGAVAAGEASATPPAAVRSGSPAPKVTATFGDGANSLFAAAKAESAVPSITVGDSVTMAEAPKGSIIGGTSAHSGYGSVTMAEAPKGSRIGGASAHSGYGSVTMAEAPKGSRIGGASVHSGYGSVTVKEGASAPSTAHRSRVTSTATYGTNASNGFTQMVKEQGHGPQAKRPILARLAGVREAASEYLSGDIADAKNNRQAAARAANKTAKSALAFAKGTGKVALIGTLGVGAAAALSGALARSSDPGRGV